MRKRNKFLYFSLAFSFFAFIDFYFSNLISQKLLGGWKFSNAIFNLVYEENTGAAFSIMQNSTTFLIILSVFALLAMFYYVIKNLEIINIAEGFFLAILGAGIAGNLAERLMFGHVRDFFNLAFVNFPIFNISDAFINVGVVGIIILIVLTKKPIKI